MEVRVLRAQPPSGTRALPDAKRVARRRLTSGDAAVGGTAAHSHSGPSPGPPPGAAAKRQRLCRELAGRPYPLLPQLSFLQAARVRTSTRSRY